MNKSDLKNIIWNLISKAENLCEALESEGSYAEYEEVIDSMRNSIECATESINDNDETF